MLDVIDVHNCYVCVLRLECDVVAPALGCDMCVDDDGCEGTVNDGDAVCASYDMGIPWELFVVDVVFVCPLVRVWGFL